MTEPLRPILLTPEVDADLLAKTTALTNEIYAHHGLGEPYLSKLRELERLTGRDIDDGDVCGAFGSVDSETFARSLLVDKTNVPHDLTRTELLQLLHFILDVQGTEWQHEYWLNCIARNTGCDDLVELIYHPEEYFGDDGLDHELTAEEILEEAFKSRERRQKRILIPAPPAGSA